MNVFSFLTALVISGAAVAIVWLLTHRALNIRIIRKQEFDKVEPIVISQENKEADKEVAPKVAAMDAVIGAVNKLMGVETPENEEGFNVNGQE